MQPPVNDRLPRPLRMLRIFSMTPSERRLYAAARRSGQFDANYYTGAYSHIHPFFLRFPLRHYVVFGEARGFRPNPDFSPAAPWL